MAALVLALQAPAALGAAADQIEGVWLYGGGAVQVSRTGPDSFVGTVVAATKFTDCVHPRGQRMWEIRGGDGTYSGTHVGWAIMETCTPGKRPARWTVRSQGGWSTLAFCAAEANSKCYSLARVDEYSFSVDLRAEPVRQANAGKLLSHFYVLSRLAGSGRLLDSEAIRVAPPSGTIVLENQNLGVPDDRITLRPMRVHSVEADYSGTEVDFDVRVRKSTLPGCGAGKTGTLRLMDNAQAPDSVSLALCGALLVFAHEPRHNDVVKVIIRSASGSAAGSQTPSPQPGAPVDL